MGAAEGRGAEGGGLVMSSGLDPRRTDTCGAHSRPSAQHAHRAPWGPRVSPSPASH